MLLRSFGSRRRAGASAPGESGAATMSMVLEYSHPTTGVVTQTTAATNGSTSITIGQYQHVRFDLTGTRFTHADSDDLSGLWANSTTRINYGEALGGSWTYPAGADSLDEDVGSPVFGRVFRNAGTFVVQARTRNSNGDEGTISVTVVVNALATGTAITTTTWPTFANNTVYRVSAGLTFATSPNTNGLHGVVLIKDGVGADPYIPTVQPDSRINEDGAITRSSNIRYVGMDIGHFTWGAVGFDYCAAVDGRVRSVTIPPHAYYFSQAVINNTGATRAGNHRFTRGWALWNTGEMNASPSDVDYCLIGSFFGATIQGVDFNRTTGTNEHVIRPYTANSVFRYCRFRASVATVSWLKGSSHACVYQQTPDIWATSDAVGDWTTARALFTTWGASVQNYTGTPPSMTGGYQDSLQFGYGYAARLIAFERNKLGESGSTAPSAGWGYGPQNNDPQHEWFDYPPATFDESNEGFELVSVQDNLISQTSVGASFGLTGRDMVVRNNLLNMGAGSNHTVATNQGPNRTPSGWNGPYITTGTRPVPTFS